jgi:hypothetical protein
MPYDAANPKHVRKAEKSAEQAEARASLFLRTSMASVEGRAYFIRLLNQCYIFQTPYTGNSNATAFNCGLQSIGLALLADMMAFCPDHYITMMKEREDGRSSTSPSPDSRHSRRSEDGGRPDSVASSDYDPIARDAESEPEPELPLN